MRIMRIKSFFIVALSIVLLAYIVLANHVETYDFAWEKKVLANIGVEFDGEGTPWYKGEKVRFLEMHGAWNSGYRLHVSSPDAGAELDLSLIKNDKGEYELIPVDLETLYASHGSISPEYDYLFEEFK